MSEETISAWEWQNAALDRVGEQEKIMSLLTADLRRATPSQCGYANSKQIYTRYEQPWLIGANLTNFTKHLEASYLTDRFSLYLKTKLFAFDMSTIFAVLKLWLEDPFLYMWPKMQHF